jgi:hypothetical protein
VIYEKTGGGWMTTVRATPNQVLGFAVEGARLRLKSEIDRTSNGEKISIPKQNLRNPNLANTETDLTLVRDGDSFYDPMPLRDDALERVGGQVTSKSLKFIAGAAVAPTAETSHASNGTSTFNLGDVVFRLDGASGLSEATIEIPGEGTPLDRALEQLFGKSKNIADLWQRAEREAESGKPILKVGWDLADEGFLLKKLFPYKVGKFKFMPNQEKYVANITLMPGRVSDLEKTLKRLTGKV